MTQSTPVLQPNSKPSAAAARGSSAFAWLNIPNQITLVRLVIALAALALIEFQMWLPACVAFFVAASTDFIDGYIARKYGLVTVLGRILDPLVDKIVVGGAFTFLAAVPDSGVRPWLVLVVIGRELFITSLRGMLEAAGRDFSAAWSGKIKMVVQCAAILLTLLTLWAGPANSVDSTENAYETLHAWLKIGRDAALAGTVITTVYSAYIYVVRAAAMLRGA